MPNDFDLALLGPPMTTVTATLFPCAGTVKVTSPVFGSIDSVCTTTVFPSMKTVVFVIGGTSVAVVVGGSVDEGEASIGEVEVGVDSPMHLSV